MGQHNKVEAELEGESRRQFMRSLLADLKALETMLAEGMFETGIRRIGAEQEMFLVDRDWRPASGAMVMLERLQDPHFTTELGMFNLELNAEPQVFAGDGIALMEQQLVTLYDKARGVAADAGMMPVLIGILPTIRKSDLGLENMVPSPRYHAINRALTALRGTAYDFSIKGIDELMVKHDSVMVEACNASFQVHYQVAPAEFADLYNLAQALAAPCLAVATNSPILFGKRLWSETRIALFQQAVDTRSPGQYLRESTPRVNFGTRWVRQSVIELYKEDIARFRTLVGTDLDEDPFEVLARHEIPKLKALRLHNGTVYRWMRACYGILDDKPHLRIENRVMPSGPTIQDEIANGAFWWGLMNALAVRYEDVTQRLEFEQAQANFFAAARDGLAAHFTWLEGREIGARTLILEELLPAAEEGLRMAKIDDHDISRYLGLVERRVDTMRTGSRWLLHSLAGMKEQGTVSERLNALVAATIQRQNSGRAVADWERARLDEAGGWKQNFMRVEQYMTTDIFSVHPDDPIDLVANLMEWERIRHVPVEDSEHRLIGLVSYRAVLRLLSGRRSGQDQETIAVQEIMRRNPFTVSPETGTLEAISMLKRFRIGCLPVVQDGRLVGIVTEENFMHIASELLEQKLNPRES
jgi:CBS domain-containing protein/gamma-glutamyl:cysteine ligase YbdK (ATP-grasp superfamily)